MSLPSTSISRSGIWRRRYAPLALGLSVALTIGLCLLPGAYRTKAGLSVGESAGRSRADALRAAAELALSKPVLARAATALVEAGVPTPDPGLRERLGVAVGLHKASGQAFRMTAKLASHVRVLTGEPGAALQIVADSADAERAARIATAVAEALVAERDEALARRGAPQESDATARLEAARAAAAAARRRLAAVGVADPLAGRTEATAQTSAAQTLAAETRVASLRAIIASGSPPLGDVKDMPAVAATLQATYLDLSRKLAAARVTLGDRHTTIIALNDGVRRAAAELTAEWKRALRIAEAELAAARQRETSPGKTSSEKISGARIAAGDPTEVTALADAQRAVRAADEAVARAEARGAEASDGETYRLVAPAPVPTKPVGWPLGQRLLLAFIAGATAWILAILGAPRHRDGAAASVPERGTEPSLVVDHGDAGDDHVEDASVEAHPAVAAVPHAEPSFFDPEPEPAPFVATPFLHAPVAARRAAVAPASHDGIEPELTRVFGIIATGLANVAPEHGPVPTVMVAAHQGYDGEGREGAGDAETSDIALGLGLVAAGQGMRVLLVEGPRAHPVLAAAVAEPADAPLLVDVFGALRVVLPAADATGLYVAPTLRNGRDIAMSLARHERAPLIDAAAFDIIIIDGGAAADSAAQGWSADAYLRVAGSTSPREIRTFLDAFGARPETFLGTVAPALATPEEPSRAPLPHVVPQPLGQDRRPGSARTMRTAPSYAAALASRQVTRRAVRAR